ncbi:MAG: hypothetical protein JNIBNLAF_00288 [Nitrosomonas europaea]|nr:hypothetical protein [Nitrosomonas europaea]
MQILIHYFIFLTTPIYQLTNMNKQVNINISYSNKLRIQLFSNYYISNFSIIYNCSSNKTRRFIFTSFYITI